MDSDEEIFLTQTKFREAQSSGEDTDSVLNDILDLEAERKNQNFDLKLDQYDDISDDDLIKHTDGIIMKTKEDNNDKAAQSEEKENVRFTEPIPDVERERLSRSRFSTKTQSKSKWAINLFNSWLGNRQEKYGNRSDNSQLKLGKEKGSGRQYLEYTEDVSKCNSGGIHHRKLKRKQTRAYENLERPERCIVSVFKKYISVR